MRTAPKFMVSMCVAAMAAVSPAYAQYSPQIEQCMNDKNTFSGDAMISACNAIIQSGRWSGKDSAWLYNNLGKAYFLKNDYDRALSEYNQALSLDPGDAYAYCGRGITKNKVSAGSGAGDIAQARKLNASLCND